MDGQYATILRAKQTAVDTVKSVSFQYIGLDGRKHWTTAISRKELDGATGNITVQFIDGRGQVVFVEPVISQ